MTLRVDLETPYKRLRDARKRAGYPSATAAADALGVVRTTYRTHENGDRAILPDSAQRYGTAFGVSPAWLLYGIEEASVERRVTVVGTVGLGAEVKMQAAKHDTIPAPPGLGSEVKALRVEGDALYPRYNDGDVLFYGKPVPYEMAQDRECVVELADEAGTPTGERLLRRVGPVARHGEVVLTSANVPSITRRVAKFLPVEWVRPA